MRAGGMLYHCMLKALSIPQKGIPQHRTLSRDRVEGGPLLLYPCGGTRSMCYLA